MEWINGTHLLSGVHCSAKCVYIEVTNLIMHINSKFLLYLISIYIVMIKLNFINEIGVQVKN